jgi:curved DNA-binding protein CbpA
MDHIDPTQSLTSHGDAPLAAANFYEVLDVSPGASRMEIREAYLRLKDTYSAGSTALYSLLSEEEAKDQLALVEEAFRVLNDDVARRDYDVRVGMAKDVAAFEREPDLAPRDARDGRDLYPRDERAGASVVDWDGGADAQGAAVIRTQRSTLAIIKLKAGKAGSDDVRAQMQQMIDAGDAGDGDLYRRMRELCDVTEDEMQERTKVSVGYLRAIEANRFDRLPQAVYVKGFLRSYFRYLAIPDAEKLVAAFSARLTDWQGKAKS